MHNHFSRSNERSESKIEARAIRLKISQAFIKYCNPKNLNVFSLPARDCCFEKQLFPFLRNEVKRFNWRAFEIMRSIFKEVDSPFPRITLDEYLPEIGKFKVSPKIGNLIYTNSQFEVSKVDGSSLIDADFCGYLTEEILEKTLNNITLNSLVMFTLYSRYRGKASVKNINYRTKSTIQALKNFKHDVNVSRITSSYLGAIADHLNGLNLPFSIVGCKNYTNTGDNNNGHGSPMVLIVIHIKENSELKNYNLGLTKHVTSDTVEPELPILPMDKVTKQVMNKTVTDTIRRNMARTLVKSGLFDNVQIDKALKLPRVTSAGFAASAARYGNKVLENLET